MSTAVNVLCPNGRRLNVKVNPNTTFLQVIEEVCTKQGFDVRGFDLKHGRTVLDVSNPFRYSGVPNNAKLELVPSEKPRSEASLVTIALQLESGERRQNAVSSDTSLLEMIKSFEKDQESMADALKDCSGTLRHPVIVNMQEEIIGVEALAYRTLRSLGLVSGKAVLRLIYREIPADTLHDIHQRIEQERVKIQKITKKQSEEKLLLRKDEEHLLIPALPCSDHQPHTGSMDASANCMGSAGTAVNSAVVQESIGTGMGVKVETVLPMTHMHFPTPLPEASTSHTEPAARNPNPSGEMAQRIGASYYQPMFHDFKFPQETAGKDLYHNELSEYDKEDYLPCDRETLVFSMEEVDVIGPVTADDDIPDEFFEVTQEDMRKLLRDIREQIMKSETAPLMTSSMRESQLEATMSKYKEAIIRLRFPDKFVVQAKFRPRETVRALKKFIQEHLDDPSCSHYLYTTPPKTVLKEESATLLQANLLPMAIVYVGFEVSRDRYLSESALALKQSRSAADNKVSLSVSEVYSGTTLRQTDAADNVGQQVRLPVQSSRSYGAESSNNSSESQAKVPKWYKPPVK